MGGAVAVKRVYDEPGRDDGARILVDRLWPRGLSRERAQLAEWLRDVAPSSELRRWYNHEPARFAEFADRYRRELSTPPGAVALERLRGHLAHGPVTLLTAVRQLERAHPQVLVTVLAGGTPADADDHEGQQHLCDP